MIILLHTEVLTVYIFLEECHQNVTEDIVAQYRKWLFRRFPLHYVFDPHMGHFVFLESDSCMYLKNVFLVRESSLKIKR